MIRLATIFDIVDFILINLKLVSYFLQEPPSSARAVQIE